jgi:hypothetical protein
MSTREAYKQKIEAEVALVQAQLVELKAQANNSAADARVAYADQVSKLEDGVTATKAKLKELGEASDDAWEHMKDSMDSAWRAVSTTASNIAAKFKTA